MHEFLDEYYPGNSHLLPLPEDIDIQKLSHGGLITSDTCNQAQKVRYRITLDISAFPDFDPHQIDWEKLFRLEPAEKCDAYVEDLSTPDRW